MESHPWLNSSGSAAVCPKCKASALKRSHAKSAYERLKTRYTPLRLFRCTACKWRGWCNPTQIQYAVVPGELPSVERGDMLLDIPLEGLYIKDIDNNPATSVSQPAPDNQAQQDGHLPATDDPLPAKWEKEAAEISLSDDAAEVRPIEKSERRAAPAAASERHLPEDYHSGRRHTSLLCPKCGSDRLYKSSYKTAYERMRKRFTTKRPYRCRSCKWRGWLKKDR